jgi:hypothetical protein
MNQTQSGPTVIPLPPQNSNPSGSSSFTQPPNYPATPTSPLAENKQYTGLRKVPLDQIVSIVDPVPHPPNHGPLNVQQESLNNFNSFMDLSQQQLIDWIEFLQRERHSISYNNSTIKAIKQTSTQVCLLGHNYKVL